MFFPIKALIFKLFFQGSETYAMSKTTRTYVKIEMNLRVSVYFINNPMGGEKNLVPFDFALMEIEFYQLVRLLRDDQSRRVWPSAPDFLVKFRFH